MSVELDEVRSQLVEALRERDEARTQRDHIAELLRQAIEREQELTRSLVEVGRMVQDGENSPHGREIDPRNEIGY